MRILLLGAGFSRNWNGWLTTELIGELLGRLKGFPQVANLLRASQNFEETLGDLQMSAGQTGDRTDLEALQKAISDTFLDMNRAFAKLPRLDIFSDDQSRSVNIFLDRFDAIFSLNQDLLFELHRRSFPLDSSYIPGALKPDGWDNFDAEKKITSTWTTVDTPILNPNLKPYFKLHGSVNWRDHKDRQLIVMGARKQATISKFPLLDFYFQQFQEYLNHGNTKVMAIGYGFGDSHVNEALATAAKNHQMEMYLVNPAGLSLFDPPANQMIGGMVRLPELRFTGISMRTFASTFSGDDLQYGSFMRFFD